MNYFLVYSFDSYSTLAQVGYHTGLIYTDDETPATPLFALFIGYDRPAPAIGNWGLVILAAVGLTVGGLTVYRRGLSSARSQ